MTSLTKAITTKPEDILETPITHKFGLCERHAHGLWEEPLNIVTNLGFFVVAYLLFRMCRYNKDIKDKKIWDIYLLIAMIVLVGVASTTFHIVPNYYTEVADIAFIIAFIVIYFMSVMVRIANATKFQLIICMLAFLGTTNSIVKTFPNAMNDSIAYLSSMMTIIFIAFYLYLKKRAAAQAFLIASIIGVCSLFFRVIDIEVCDELPVGTHFIWHMFNALLIYILMKQLVRSVNRRARMLRMAGEYGL